MTVLLAILLALGVPFAQLHTTDDRVTCCCPDPDTCKCPDHQPDSDHSTMRACHKGGPSLQHAPLAVFIAPAIPVVDVDAPAVRVVDRLLPEPHAPPALRRPDGPS